MSGARYKIEYPFQAIDATLGAFARTVAATGMAEHVDRRQRTSGSVEYYISYAEMEIVLGLHALDTRLCLLSVAVAGGGKIEDIRLREMLDEIAGIHEQLILEAERAETVLAADRGRGGRETWPEDLDAIARLQAGQDRAVVKQEWLKHVARNRKRKKIADTDNRFRQLVSRANKS